MAFRRRGIEASLIAVIVLVSGTMVAFSASAANGPPTDDWTVALYVAADNNLEWAWDHYSLRSLLKIPESDDVNIVAMVDRLSTNEIELLEFVGDSYEVVDTYPEMDMSESYTLTFFLEETSARYPSDHLCVVAWDHGGSWLGFCTDDSDGSIIRMDDFSNAVENAGTYIDIFVLDACIMSTIEVAYEASTTDLITYLISSEMYVPWDGLPYDDMFTPLAADPSTSPEDLCTMILDGYDAYYHRGRSVNLVLTDVAAVGESMPKFQAFSEALTAGIGVYDVQYAASVGETETNDYLPATVDLYDLCENLIDNVPDKTIADSCLEIMMVVDTVVLDIRSSGWAAEMHGLTIWWGSEAYMEYFYSLYMEDVHFATDSGWGAYLGALYA